MSRRDFTFFFTGIVLVSVIGCSTNTDLGGSGVPNSRPETRVTGQPPTLLQAGYTVHFNWTGNDPDGKVVGYQWKISDNGTDGISPRDTLTTDPLTGAMINPWHYTTANDTVFYVLADLEDFPGDPAGIARSYRTHSLFVRAVDNDGAVDPSPALISFTSTTIIPTCRAIFPSIRPDMQTIAQVPATVNLGYSGTDSDYDLKTPTHMRYLWKPSLLVGAGGLPVEVISEHAYNANKDLLVAFDDPEWSAWKPYALEKEKRVIRFEDREDQKPFLFAVQVRDTAGATSIGKDYQRQVLNVRIMADRFAPTIRLFEVFQGDFSSNANRSLAADQPLNFSWTADASSYNGTIVSMRYGWDVVDENDANDLGWVLPPGLTEEHRFAQERSYSNGEHSFLVRATDDAGSVSSIRFGISIIPYVSLDSQLNLALVDQVIDNNTNNWPDHDTHPSVFYDREIHRLAFWRFLGDNGGVSGFSWDDDAYYTGDNQNLQFDYSDAVNYKAVLIFARKDRNQPLFRTFRPVGPRSPFVWLAPYQSKGGNLFLVGARSMESFLEDLTYMVPIIFDSTVDEFSIGDDTYVTGFGEGKNFDGSTYFKGPRMYPYATAGISALDWSTPMGNKYIYGRALFGVHGRDARCSSIKEFKLVDAFKTEHFIGSGVIADTLGTNPLIDWRDLGPSEDLDLLTTSPFVGDEFVNDKLADSPMPLVLQDCAGGVDGYCIEPMYSGIARMDWMREKKWEDGDSQWPTSSLDVDSLKTICGDVALTTYLDDNGALHPFASAKTTGRTFGWLSYKNVLQKPSGKADVYWGFDPYRLEVVESQKAIMWVLQYFGLPVRIGG